ncbi:MAG: V-type ATPase 116kDa subunit family protein [Sedimenticolaceae bacterium]|nr:V-type ATPase 116kDa subunit family protein [Sedimenticolaceae bacterium]
MFGALPMQHVTLYLLRDELPRAAMVLARLGVIAPEESKLDQDETARPGLDYQRSHHLASQLFRKIAASLDYAPDGMMQQDLPQQADQQRLDATLESLQPVWHQCNRLEEQVRSLREEIRHLTHQQQAVAKFFNLHLDLEKLSLDHGFLDMRVGSVDISELQRLRESLALVNFKVIEFDRQEGRVHLVLLGLKGLDAQLNPVLMAAGFKTLLIPQGLKGYPDEMHAGLEERLARLRQELADVEGERTELLDKYRAELREAERVLAAAAPYAELADYLVGHGEIVTLQGWVPEVELDALAAALRKELTAFFREMRKPLPEEIDRVPSVQRYPAFLRPFSILVRNFGTPRYDEFDPTLLFALTFILMFGSMFGDIGHGAVMLVAGWFFRRKLRDFTWFIMLAGLSSILFGVFYGSIFGHEELNEPLWMSPMEDPVRLLVLAVYWGIGFIALANLLSTFNLWRLGLRREALLGQRGLAGLLFYAGLLLLVADFQRTGSAGMLSLSIVALGGSILIAGAWRESDARGGERLLIVVIEMVETLLGYMSNTLSFLRVAAFSLNHAALAFAVITIAGMMEGVGHWLALIIGNLVIIVLEGGIVLIQVLRLEYYEGFVRFFRGDGRVYKPLRLQQTGTQHPAGQESI